MDIDDDERAIKGDLEWSHIENALRQHLYADLAAITAKVRGENNVDDMNLSKQAIQCVLTEIQKQRMISNTELLLIRHLIEKTKQYHQSLNDGTFVHVLPICILINFVYN